MFGSSAYFRLWMAQVVSSLGDWIGLVAVVALAARLSKGSSAAVGLVMAARMVPGFFLAPVRRGVRRRKRANDHRREPTGENEAGTFYYDIDTPAVRHPLELLGLHKDW